MEGTIITLRQAAEAFTALNSLEDQEMTRKTAYRLDKLRGKLEHSRKYFDDSVRKLLEKYRPTQDADGKLHVGTPEQAQNFDREYEEICDIEVIDLKFDPVYIAEEDNLKVSMKTVRILDGFVVFGEEEETEEAEPDLKILPAETGKED